ncbi:MAG TPA: hypothetical protein VNL91_11840 [Thermoanaerobaculia bacterium]|nr:hypothetical protein [Thermoanaerobaculia bacterium]
MQVEQQRSEMANALADAHALFRELCANAEAGTIMQTSAKTRA